MAHFFILLLPQKKQVCLVCQLTSTHHFLKEYTVTGPIF